MKRPRSAEDLKGKETQVRDEAPPPFHWEKEEPCFGLNLSLEGGFVPAKKSKAQTLPRQDGGFGPANPLFLDKDKPEEPFLTPATPMVYPKSSLMNRRPNIKPHWALYLAQIKSPLGFIFGLNIKPLGLYIWVPKANPMVGLYERGGGLLISMDHKGKMS